MAWRNTLITFTDDYSDLDLSLYDFVEIKQGFMVFKWANLVPRTSVNPEYVYVDRNKIRTIQHDED